MQIMFYWISPTVTLRWLINRIPSKVYNLLRFSVTSQSIQYESLDSTSIKFDFQTYPVIVESCNGLLLVNIYETLSTHFYDPILVNPLVLEKYRLPSVLNCSTRLQGFGYVSSVDDYKVVRLCIDRKAFFSYDHYCSELEVQIYSLKADSWKCIPGRVPFTKIAYMLTPGVEVATHVQGSVYWIVYDSPYQIRDVNKSYVILGFDLKTEKFSLVETPLDYDGTKLPHNLVQVQGRLGAYRSDNDADETVIWVWNEDENGKGFWIEYIRIPRKSGVFERVISFMNNNEVLLHVFEEDSEKLVI